MFKVRKEKCDECLFSENRIVSKGRMAQIVTDCRKNDTHFICHKASMTGDDICCRGSYEAINTNLIRIAQRLNMVQVVD